MTCFGIDKRHPIEKIIDFRWHGWRKRYAGWAKKVSLVIIALTLSTANNFYNFLVRIAYTIGNQQVALGHRPGNSALWTSSCRGRLTFKRSQLVLRFVRSYIFSRLHGDGWLCGTVVILLARLHGIQWRINRLSH